MTDWVRLWHDMPTDPKWRVIARKSGQPLPCVIALFTLLMTTASAAEDRGNVSGLSIEDAAAALDMDEEAVAAILGAMDSRVITDGRLSGWDRRQPKREDNSAERVKAYRERQRTQGNAGEQSGTHVKRVVTQGDAPDTEQSREDTEEKAYAFSARVVRLTQPDYDDWQKQFFAIPDFDGELHAVDAWLIGETEAKQRKWFGSAASWLSRRHQEHLANRQRAGPKAVVGI